MKKTLSRLADRLAAGLLAVALVCGVLSCDNGSSKDSDSDDGGSNATYSVGDTKPAGLVMLSAADVNLILSGNLGANDDSVLKSFKASSVAPSGNVTTYKFSSSNSSVDVLAWLDGTTIYYYAQGYTDSGKKIPLPDSRGLLGFFASCKGLESIDMSGFDTSNTTAMVNMFFGCSNLTSLNLDGWDTSKVEDMSSMFCGCSSLTALDLSGWNTGNVTSMGSMFSGCTNLVALGLSSWNTGNVTSMGSMFKDCTHLVTLDLSSWNTGNVTSMGSMFKNCSNLVTLDISSWNTGNVGYLESMFENCSHLVTLDLSNWNTGNVRDVSGMFSGCSSLTTIYVSDHFVVETASDYSLHDGGVMFKLCSSLVGGAGTTYSNSHKDKSYARIDGGSSAPGYFTAAP